MYHINAVDCVTQFQLVATCEKISEAYLLPVIRQLLEEFPFVILGFHADNGSEYVNYQVATMLEKLRIACTKSRPRHSNDNALAESKNGAVVRKHLGYAHIPQQYAGRVNVFCAEVLNPYVNFHRPCFFPETITDEKGKERKRYRYAQMMTPYDKLRSLPDAAGYLKPGVTFTCLDATASRMSDNEAATAVISIYRDGRPLRVREPRTQDGRSKVRTRPRQNRVQRLRFTDRRSDSFLYWKILG